MGLRDSNWMLFVRLAQAVFGIIVLGLTAYVINWENERWWGSADSVNFMLFNSIWTLLIVLPYLCLVPNFFIQLSNVRAILALEIITMIFWFSGFIALAAALPPASGCGYSACQSAQAASAFGAFEWVLFSITTAFGVRLLMRPAQAKTAPQAATPAGV
ncbi:hypothetical protein VTN96DRAFT_5693 [Rasamsonia emersonii]